jgi:hypothetical protein
VGERSEAAELIMGAALLDARSCALLLEERARALGAATHQPCAPAHVRLTAPEREALVAIPARTLQEFAQGVVGEPLLAGGRSLHPGSDEPAERGAGAA